MIITEFYTIRTDGITLLRTYSDQNLHILQKETDAIYDEAIDTSPLRFTYEETDIPIEIPDSIEMEDLNGNESLL